MTIEERQTVVQTNAATPSGSAAGSPTSAVTSRDTVVSTTRNSSDGDYIRRIIIFVFGLLQGLIVLRIVFLLLDARESNGLVSGILNLSQVFVAPFEGILSTNAFKAGGSVLDVAAIVAIVGWTVLEFLIIATVRVVRRDTA